MILNQTVKIFCRAYLNSLNRVKKFMSKSPPNPSINKLNFSEDWASNPAVEWLSSNKQTILWIFGGLLALLILAYRLVVSHTESSESDFFRAQTAFAEFQQEGIQPKDQTAAAATLEELDALMKRHPELKPKYEGSLAQTLLISGQAAQAVPYAEDIFNRTKPDHLKLYQDYSKTSLLIAQGKDGEALTQALLLKKTIDEDANQTSDSTLYIFNLIRLAMLHQQLGQKEEELKMWEQIQKLSPESESLAFTNHAFMIGQASLAQYIGERKKSL